MTTGNEGGMDSSAAGLNTSLKSGSVGGARYCNHRIIIGSTSGRCCRWVAYSIWRCRGWSSCGLPVSRGSFSCCFQLATSP